MKLKLTSISKGFYCYDYRTDPSLLPWCPERPLESEPGFSFIRGNALDSIIFTIPEIDARFFRPEISRSTPFYASIPKGSHLPRASANCRSSIPLTAEFLPLITKPLYRGSYSLEGSGRVRYCPPTSLPKEAYASIGYHVASPNERFFVRERIIPIAASNDEMFDLVPAGVLLPIQYFEEAAALGLEVLSATALTSDGLIADRLTLLDPVLAGCYLPWLREFPRWSRITFLDCMEESFPSAAMEAIPLTMVSRLDLTEDHYFILGGDLILTTSQLAYREGAEPIESRREYLTYFAEPWHAVQLAVAEAIADYGDNRDKALYQTAGLALEASDIGLETLVSPLATGDDAFPF